MQRQKAHNWCGPAAICNALSAYGHYVGQSRAAELAGTAADGSDEQDIIKALDALGYAPAEFHGHSEQEARAWLMSLSPVMPLILCVDRWCHWVTITGQCAGRLIVVDSDSIGALVTARRPKRILNRWRATRSQRAEGAPFYGIAVVKQ